MSNSAKKNEKKHDHFDTWTDARTDHVRKRTAIDRFNTPLIFGIPKVKDRTPFIKGMGHQKSKK